MIKLRKYQQEIIDYIEAGFAFGSNKVCAEAPTGSGKSLMMSELCRIHPDDKIIISVGITKLIGQISDHLKMLGLDHSILKAGRDDDYDATKRIQLVMEQTFHSRKPKLECDILIRDEGHIGTEGDRFKGLLEISKPDRIVLFSATPYDSHGVALPGYEIAPGPSIKSLTDEHYLMPAKTLVFPEFEKIDFSKIGKSGDYSESELDNLLNNPEYNNDVVNTWMEHSGGKKTIVFVSGIQHAEDLAKAFDDAGIGASALHSKQATKVQESIMANFRGAPGLTPSGIQVLVSVSQLTTGFDMPDANCVVLARPTKVRSLNTQMIGRVLRPSGDPLGHARILDCCQSTRQHGLYDAVYSIPKVRGKAREHLAAMKVPVTEWAAQYHNPVYMDEKNIVLFNKKAAKDDSLPGLAYRIKISIDPANMLALGCMAYEKIWGVKVDGNTRVWILKEMLPGVRSFGLQPFKTRMMNIIKGKDGKLVKMASLHYMHKFLKERSWNN